MGFGSVFVHHVCVALRVRQGVRVPGGEQDVPRLAGVVEHSSDGAGAGYVPLNRTMSSHLPRLCPGLSHGLRGTRFRSNKK